MSEHDESDDIIVPTPEEVDEEVGHRAPRHLQDRRDGGDSGGERRGISRLLRRVRGDVGRNRVRAPAPSPVRPSRPSEPVDLPPSTPVEEDPVAALATATEAPAAAPPPPPPPPPDDRKSESSPSDEPEGGTPAGSQPPRLRKVRVDRVQRRPEPTDTTYESPNGAPIVRARAGAKGHVLGDFKTEWDGNNRTESAQCVNCGEWGHAIFEVAEGWTEATAYPQYKGKATNSRCRYANGGQSDRPI